MSDTAAPSPDAAAVTVVTQTRVRDGREADFAAWQKTISERIAREPGFLRQTVIPPSPPTQLDWVILQRFSTREDALAWLRSDTRKRLVAEAGDLLIGNDDVHLLKDDSEAPATPVSVVISTRVKPGREATTGAGKRRSPPSRSRRRASRATASRSRFPASRTTSLRFSASIRRRI